MSTAQPGDPAIDIEARQKVADAIAFLRKQVRNLDTKTLYDIGSDLLLGQSIVEKFKGVRAMQATAIVGGGRRRR